jgi:hypothetical protein
VQADVIDNADEFRRSEGESDGEPTKASEFHRYMVNVLIDAGAETPVVFADRVLPEPRRAHRPRGTDGHADHRFHADSFGCPSSGERRLPTDRRHQG